MSLYQKFLVILSVVAFILNLINMIVFMDFVLPVIGMGFAIWDLVTPLQEDNAELKSAHG